MAFAFLVGDSSTAGANSFVSVAEFRDHFPGAKGHDGADLTAVADADLERFLVFGARMLEMVPCNGTTKNDENDEIAEILPRLPFPRYSCAVALDAHPSLKGLSVIDDTVVPGVVKVAQIELAEELRIRDGAGERLVFRGVQDRYKVLKSKRTIVGSSKAWADPTAALQFPRVAALLRGLYTFHDHPVAIAV